MVQSHPRLKFYFPLFLGMVLYDNELGNKIEAKNKIEPQHKSFTYFWHVFEKRFAY